MASLLLLVLTACGTPPLYWAEPGSDSVGGSANPSCCSCVCETCTLTVECNPVCDEPCSIRCEEACNVCSGLADAAECP